MLAETLTRCGVDITQADDCAIDRLSLTQDPTTIRAVAGWVIRSVAAARGGL